MEFEDRGDLRYVYFRQCGKFVWDSPEYGGWYFVHEPIENYPPQPTLVELMTEYLFINQSGLVR